tara:strand:- start:35 stop:661 length:627 start_codon:yes stop_codon:yes gene_type:complete
VKKWTAKQTQVNGNITAEDFNEEYCQYKSVLNGAIDRRAAPAGTFTHTHLTNGAITKAFVFFKRENNLFLDTTNTPDANDSFRCTTFSSYAGSWFTAYTQPITGMKEGWVQLELGGMVFTNPYQSVAAGGLQKNIFMRLVWNNQIIAEAGPVSQGLHNFRLVAGTFNAGAAGDVKLQLRFANKQDGDSATAPIYHVFNLNLLVIGRWR